MKEILKYIVTEILSREAALLLKRTKPTIIAITGNVGKTTTKDAVYAVVSTLHHARKSDKSFNSEIGVPLTILGLPNAWSSPMGWIKNCFFGLKVALFSKEYPPYLVLEIGADHPGDIERITTWLKPHVTVITHIPHVPVHVEFFLGPEHLVREKQHLARALSYDGALVLDADSEFSLSTKDMALPSQRVITYGKKAGADIQVLGVEPVYAEEKVGRRKLCFPIGENIRIVAGPNMGTEYTVPLRGTIGMHRAYPVLAAIAVGMTLGIDVEKSIEAVSSMEPTKGRMRLIDGIKQSVIIDDTYNSSPIALSEGLSSVKKVTCKGRKIVIVGDMLELGAYSKEAHYDIGKKVAKVADILITVGFRARDIARGALEHGMPETAVYQLEKAVEAGKLAQTLVEIGDYIYVKGSQGMRMERTVEEIMADPERASSLLVRQDTVWKNKS